MKSLARCRRRVGKLNVEVRPGPLTLVVRNAAGQLIQEVVFADDGTLSFKLDEHPVLGMGEGGPRPQKGENWREQSVQFDRRGALDTMEPRWQSDMYGSRNPVAMLLGTERLGDVRRDAVGPGRPARSEPRRVPARSSRRATRARRRPSAISSRRSARAFRRSMPSSRDSTISSSSTRTIRRRR